MCRARRAALATSLCLLGAAAVGAGPGVAQEPRAPDPRAWLESMAVHHGYAREEMQLATGLDAQALDRALVELHLTEEEVRARPRGPAPPRDRVLVLPYPGGRHPRIGFLDGAVDPRRDTKVSIFLPWEGAGYVVADLPEALWSNLGLTFLAHTHIPTVWDKQGVKLEPREWTLRKDGVLENAFPLPNGIEIRARVIPRRDVVDLELRLVNGTREKLTGLRTQVCLLLKGAPDFDEQTRENKVVSGRAIAARSRDGKRWIATVWERARPWDNPPCPCVHSDPTFPDLEPGAEATLRGRVFFFEGEDIRAEIARRERKGTLDARPGEPEAKLVSVRRIWDAAPHNAFTDLVRFRGEWLCTFREGAGHVSPDGAIRVIASADGETWASAAIIRSETGDLRDPKLTVMPDGRLHLLCASALHVPPPRHQTLVWTSKGGRAWEGPAPAGEPDLWLWRVAWRGKEAYGVGYATEGASFVRLYRSEDGVRFERFADRIFPQGEPNETSIVFLHDGTAHCLLRRDDPKGNGQLGDSRPPYSHWSWRDLGARIGGPHMLRIPDGRLVAAVRLYEPRVRTSLAWIDPSRGSMREVLELPSGGDTSYAGLVHHDGLLWVSYYSSHEGKTSIYLAKVKLAPRPDEPFGAEYRAFIRGASPAEDDARAVAVDAQGRVWAATAAGVLRAAGGKLEPAPGEPCRGPAFDVLAGSEGRAWAATWRGVARLGEPEADASLAWEGGPITALAEAGGRIVAGGPDGVIEIPEDGPARKVPGGWPTSIRALAVQGEALYVGTSIGLFALEGGTTRRLTQLGGTRLSNDDVRTLALLPTGELAIGTAEGIDQVQPGDGGPSFERAEGLPCTDVRSLASDRRGRLWAATALGVARRDGPNRWALRHGLRWLPSDDARDVAIGPDGTAWVATAAGIAVLRERPMTLAEKADHYLSIARARHVRPPGLVEQCLLRVPGDLATWEPRDDDNDGSYTGLYLAAECCRWAATRAPDAQANAVAAFRALELLQDVTGTPGFLARTVVPADWSSYADPNRAFSPEEAAAERAGNPRWKRVENRWRKSADGKWLWKGDTSSDEVTGHFFAYSVYHDLIGDEEEKARAARLARRVMDGIIDGGYVLRDLDGQATRWGVWSPEKLNGDPNWQLERGVNSVEILSYLTVTKAMTGDPRYEREIERLLRDHGYAENVRDPQRSEPAVFTYIDTELLAFAYRGLLAHEADPARRKLYLQGLEKWYALVEEDHSPLYGFIYAAATGKDIALEECVEFLKDCPLDLVQWTADGSRREDVRLVRRPASEVVQTDRILPASERAIIRWDRNARAAVQGHGGHTESPGSFWLCPYWMGRCLGLVGEP